VRRRVPLIDRRPVAEGLLPAAPRTREPAYDESVSAREGAMFHRDDRSRASNRQSLRAARRPWGFLARSAAGLAAAALLVLPFAGQAAAQGREEHHEHQEGRDFGQRGHVQQRPEHHVGRVAVHGERDVVGYRRPFAGRPGFRSYGVYYGLVPGLQLYPSLGFLADGLLVGSYPDDGGTDYVYLVQEDGVNRRYVVTNQGRIRSAQVIP
jgi:hypothetical protein